MVRMMLKSLKMLLHSTMGLWLLRTSAGACFVIRVTWTSFHEVAKLHFVKSSLRRQQRYSRRARGSGKSLRTSLGMLSSPWAFLSGRLLTH